MISQKVSSSIWKTLVYIATILTFGVLIFLVAYILINGIPYLKPSLFSLTYTSENVSLVPAAVNTLIMTVLSLAIANSFWAFYRCISSGICQARESVCGTHPSYSRDLVRDSLHCLRSVRSVVLRNLFGMGVFPDWQPATLSI